MFSSAQFLFLTRDGVAAQLAAVQLAQRPERRPTVHPMPDDQASRTLAPRRVLPLFRRLRLATS